MKIRLAKPSIGKEEFENIKDAFESSWLELGPKV